MKLRIVVLACAGFAMAGCSWLPHHHKAEAAAPQQQTLFKSLTGEVDYSLSHPLPPDAVLEVILADTSGADAHTITSDRIAPVGASPVPFVLSYEPDQIKPGGQYAISARIRAGERTFASSDTDVSVLRSADDNGPVRVSISEIH